MDLCGFSSFYQRISIFQLATKSTNNINDEQLAYQKKLLGPNQMSN